MVGHNPRYGMGNDPRSWQRRLPGTAEITSAATCEVSEADVMCRIGLWTLTVAMTPVSVHDHERYLARSASIINTQLRVRLRVGVLLPGPATPRRSANPLISMIAKGFQSGETEKSS